MSDFDDFLEETEEETPDGVKEKVTLLVNEHRSLEAELVELKKQSSEIMKKLVDLEQRQIPDALLEAGLSEIRTMDGLKVSTKTFVGSIPADKRDTAFAWLDSHGHGDIIKRSVSVAFGKGQEEASEKAMETLRQNGLEPISKMDVHYQTFQSFAKEQMEKGKSLPLDQWGVYYGQKAVIKKT